MNKDNQAYPKSCVYWIHLKSHTDPFNQGYVGVSVNGAEHRFKKHKLSVKNGSKLTVHNAIRKHGGEIVVTTLIKGHPEYCLLMEEKLRPVAFAEGTWNMCQGGASKQAGISPSAEVRKKLSDANKGLEKSAETREKLSIANKGKTLLESTKQKLREVNVGKVATEGKLEKMRANMAEIGSWAHSYSDPAVWTQATTAHNYYLENPTHGPRRLSHCLKCTENACSALLKKLRKGWIPSEDFQYLDWLFKQKEAVNAQTQPA